MDKQQFLANIAGALGRTKPLSTPPARKELGPPAFWLEQEHDQDNTLEMFKNNLEALTGRFKLAQNKSEVQKQIRDWLAELECKKIICWDQQELIKTVEPESLGVKLIYWNDDIDPQVLIAEASQTEVGLTWADYGVAYTGTLALYAKPQQGRTVSLLPSTHIAVLPKSRIVPTMSTVIKDLEKKKTLSQMPSCINFISGPSRSADIEMDLSIGVHGPYRTWVIVLNE